MRHSGSLFAAEFVWRGLEQYTASAQSAFHTAHCFYGDHIHTPPFNQLIVWFLKVKLKINLFQRWELLMEQLNLELEFLLWPLWNLILSWSLSFLLLWLVRERSVTFYFSMFLNVWLTQKYKFSWRHLVRYVDGGVTRTFPVFSKFIAVTLRNYFRYFGDLWTCGVSSYYSVTYPFETLPLVSHLP